MPDRSQLSSPRRGKAYPLLVAAVVILLAANLWLLRRVSRDAAGREREHDFWILCQTGSTPAERAAAFRRLAAAGHTQWRAADVRLLDLSGIALPGADLQFIRFLRTQLAGARLEGARLCSSNLELADLTRAQLMRADLREARLLQATLVGADLRGANLAASFFAQVHAAGANLMGADLSDANCLMADLTGAQLKGANFSGAKLESAVLKSADLTDARLEGADLTDANFTNANWWRTRGLTMTQLAMLKQHFAPTPDADPALREDYARWSGETDAR